MKSKSARDVFAKQLKTAVAGFTSLGAVSEKILADTSDRYRLSVSFTSASFDFGARGELALVQGDAEGWQLLAAARRARAFQFLLGPSVTPSSTAALAAIEAIQWQELATAKSLVTLMLAGLRKDWALNARLKPSATEIESLAFSLALRANVIKRASLPKDREIKGLLPLKWFGAAANQRALPAGEGAAALEQMFDEFASWCDDQSIIPRGARLSAAPVYAGRKLIPGLQDVEHVEHSLFDSPFKDVKSKRRVVPPKELKEALAAGRAAALRAGFDVDP